MVKVQAQLGQLSESKTLSKLKQIKEKERWSSVDERPLEGMRPRRPAAIVALTTGTRY